MNRFRFFFLASVWPALLLASPLNTLGQEIELSPVTRTYAVTNARIVQAPGRVIERGTVVMRDGLILAVGQDVEIPYDARRIDGASLVVYAGFIDGLSHAGIETPEPPEQCEDVEKEGDPPAACAGIQPQREASALLDPADEAIDTLRKLGFTAAHVVPEGSMLPGTGAVILLAGTEPSDLILEAEASLFGQFEEADGVYPATDMGVIVKLRELYHQAERRLRIGATYAEDPAGLRRPPHDAVHSAFFPVIEGERPLFIYTEGALDIHRALALQETLGFPLALAGLHRAFDTIGALQQAEVPLFLALDLPEAPEDTSESVTDTVDVRPDKAVTPERPGDLFMSDARTLSYKDLDDEKENLQARQALIRRQYYRTAGLLDAAGLSFGFTTIDVKPEDVRKNLRTMIEHGLPEEAALAALTTDAAALLGLSERLGTVEEGKIANLVVTTSSYFDEEGEVRYVFVDGRLFEYEPEEDEPAEAEEEAVNPAGTWRYTVSAPQEEVEGTLTIEGDPDESGLGGSISSEMTPDPMTLEGVQLEGNELTFSFDAGEMGRISATLTLEGDELEGTFEVPDYGELPVTGTRTAGPEAR